MKNLIERLPARPFVLVLLLSLLLLPSGRTQGTSASVTGAVTDFSGANIAGATVTYINVATGVKASATTNDAGIYRVAGLLPGEYSGSVLMPGFKTAVRQGINLQVEDQVKLDFALEVGAVTESVTVESGATLLETQSPTVSQVIEGRQVEDTPLNGRNAMNLIALTPGVVPQGSTTGSLTGNANGGSSTNAQAFGNYAIAGGLANQGSVYVDGAPVNSVEAHVTSLIPAQDSVQEFRVETSVVNPQYGEFSGGIVSFVTKSGGNALHGTAYEYLRNTIFNANNFFLSGVNQARPKQIQNQFGASMGGLIKKDKAFFYLSYEGLRSALGVPNLGRVPTAAELQGDFTADPKIVNPVPTLVNNPGTAPIAQYNQAKCNGVLNKFCLLGQPTQPGDAIIDPTSYYMANTLHYFPLPNTMNAGPAYNFSQTGKASSYLNTVDSRIDYSVGKQKLFAKYARLYGTQLGTQFVFNNPTAPSSGTSFGTSTTQVVLGDTIVPNSTSVVDIRVSYLRFDNSSIPSSTNLAGYGPFYAGIANQVDYPSFPSVVLSNSAPQPFVQLSFFTRQPTNHYVVSGTYSKQLGRHSLSFGGEARRREEYPVLNPATTGLYIFAGTSTSCIPSALPTAISFSDAQHFVSGISCGPVGGPPTNLVIPGTGATPVADFVSGQFTVAPLGIQTSKTPSSVNRYDGLFVNDSFQLSSKLTLTAGLRYELPGGFVEKRDDNAILLPKLANPLVLVNSAAYSRRSDLQSHTNLFSPRIGFAFQPYAGTTVRAGYSLAYLPMDIVYTSGPSGSSIVTATTFVPAGNLISAPLGYLSGTTTPATTLIKPIGRAEFAANPTYFYGQTISGRNPTSGFPFLQQYNANVQHEFGSNGLITQIAYLGARGQHLPIAITYNINQLPDNATLSQANRPYPQYQNVNENSAWIGDTYYNSLQATLTKRFKSGGTFLANYSWSKLLGTADSTNPFAETHSGGVIQDYSNTRGERSYTSFDVPQRLVISYILDLPVGEGKHFLGDADGVVNTLVSGWNASGINTFQSGFPLAITALNNIVGEAFGGGTIRPNTVTGCNKKVNIGYVQAAQQQKSIINPACFSNPGPTNPNVAPVAGNFFGNEPRTDGQTRTQGVDNWDFSIGKTTPLHESVNLVFRAEAFNVTNRVQFGDPGLSFGSGIFGLLTTQANAPRSFQFSLRMNY